jgi:Right handed beta helix region
MLKGFGVGILLTVELAFPASPLCASDFFVAPSGTPFGPGTLEAPYDLVTALSGQVSQPGDTFWLRGGDYRVGHLNTTIQGTAGQPITFRQVTGERARVDGSISLFNSSGNLVFRDFELYSSNTNRVSAQTGVGFNVTDITILPGFASYAPNVSFINLVVHDQTRHGIYTSQISSNTLVYGCIVFNNGWVSPDNAEGHGLYVQGQDGFRTIADNIVFNNSGASMHLYENDPGQTLVGINLDGNVAFGAGAIQTVRLYRDWIVGVDSPALCADGIVMRNNMGYLTPGLSIQPEVQIGRDLTNGTLVLADNYMPLPLVINNWSKATVTGNLFATTTNYIVSLNQTLTSLSATWDRNTYIGFSNEFLVNFQPYSSSGWQAATGFDKDSIFVSGTLGGTRIFVRTNLFETGRATIIVYNWDRLDNVAVDVSAALTVGSGFEVHNAQDFFGPPVLSGTYTGQPLELPMTNLSVALPNGPLATPPPTGPTFNVFVLRPTATPLQMRQAGGSVQITWPLSYGANALQWTAGLSALGWNTYTNTPAVVGGQFMIIEPVTQGRKFYRLRSG